MSNEFFDGFAPLVLKVALVAHHFQLIHKSVNILYQDVVSGDQYLLLLAGAVVLLACLHVLLRIRCRIMS